MSETNELPHENREMQEKTLGPAEPKTPRSRRMRKSRKTRVGLHQGLTDAISRMPELCHNPRTGRPFDISRSETANWLVGTAVADPAFRKALHDAAYRARLIAYDRERHTWRGRAHGTDING